MEEKNREGRNQFFIDSKDIEIQIATAKTKHIFAGTKYLRVPRRYFISNQKGKPPKYSEGDLIDCEELVIVKEEKKLIFSIVEKFKNGSSNNFVVVEPLDRSLSEMFADIEVQV